MNIPYVFKRCSKCGEWLVASKVNFYKVKTGKYGLSSTCKKCKAEQYKQYYDDNRDKILEQKKQYGKQYYDDNKDKILERNKQYRENNKDNISEYKKQYYENNKDKLLERQKQYYENNKDNISEYKKQYREDNRDKMAERYKQYYENNKDKLLERQKQYYENNKDKLLERNKQYREDNRDKLLERQKQYYENNRDKIAEQRKQYRATAQGQVVTFNYHCRRRTKEQNQGNGITSEQWLEMMKYFDWKCAYSGNPLKNKTRTIDHIKPLNQGGKHEIWNVVPMDRGLNSSKCDKDMEEWYQEQDFYSEERLQKIYEWQEYAYNKWHKEEIV